MSAGQGTVNSFRGEQATSAHVARAAVKNAASVPVQRLVCFSRGFKPVKDIRVHATHADEIDREEERSVHTSALELMTLPPSAKPQTIG